MNNTMLGTIRLKTELDHRINFAMQQNDVPVLTLVAVENGSDTDLSDLRLLVTAEPEFANPLETRIDLIPGGSTFSFDSVDLKLSPEFLEGLTERIRGQLRFELFQGDDRLVEHIETVELLARDEWNGINSSLPEILAAFVMPNHPTVERILRDAADILEDWTGDPSLSGYQSQDPRRVFTMAAAIYTSLRQQGISYVNPPASFEKRGQRIRLPDRIVEAKLATCLDLAVLAAGCLEQTGLHPLLVLVRGHAFVGFWLQEECFAEPVVDDPLRLRKRVDLNEIAVFDPTCATSRPGPEFSGAVEEAKRRLVNPEEFTYVIDVSRSRKVQMRPIPVRVEHPAAPLETDRDEPNAGGASSAPDVSEINPSRTPQVEADGPEAAASRLDRWSRRLLDLTLRNRLLNFKETKKTIPLLVSDIGSLEDVLAEGVNLEILPRPKDLGEGDPRDPEAHRRRTGIQGIANLLQEQLRSKRLHADLSDEELYRRFLETYRAAKLSIEEGGSSSLYLAIGFLTWYESQQSSQPRLAPILLLPVELHRRSVHEGFTLKLGDDEPRLNVTLMELLQKDHGLTIPGLDPLPGDESGIDVPKIFRIFRESIRDIDRWDISDVAQIGLFSFAKFLMWRDLVERSEDLMQNSVVDHLVNKSDQAFDPGAIFPNPDYLDKERSPLKTFCPLPADASQLAAVFSAAEGHSFVLEGPPGTGKSQTITNLVAHCLAEGKRVLFVSEKMAALNIVYGRLQQAGLGNSCLELHSNKTNKREVLSQIEKALNSYENRTSDEWEGEARRIENLRTDLNMYVDSLHRLRSTGESVFQATSRLIGLRDAPRVDLGWLSLDGLDESSLAQVRDMVGRLATAGKALGEVHGHPWESVRFKDWTPAWEEDARGSIRRFQEALKNLEHHAKDVSRRVSLKDVGWSLDELALLDELTGALLNSSTPTTAILVRPDWDDIQNQIGNWIERGRSRDRLRFQVFDQFNNRVLTLDLDALQLQIDQANLSWWPMSWLKRRRVINALKPVRQNIDAPNAGDLSSVLAQLLALRDGVNDVLSVGGEARSLLGRYWDDGEAKWEELEGVVQWTGWLRSLATRAAGGDVNLALTLRETWARLATEGSELLQQDEPVGRELMAYRAAYKELCEARNKVNENLNIDLQKAWGKSNEADAVGFASRTLLEWSESAAQLRDWCAWLRTRDEANHLNLTRLVEAYESSEFVSGDLQRTFESSYYHWWHTMVVSGDPVLTQFFSPEHQRKIDQFRQGDQRYLELTPQIISARLLQQLPVPSSTDLPKSEVGILKREIGKRSRHMSVRTLFQTIPNLLPRLKPCLLMSPMSVAQYLDSSYPRFDLVVFDEASQIPVWDAVGAIARGKQAVIVGDPKQLPPTNFFQHAEEEEDEATEAEVVEDLESILDECLSARLPWLPLNWHYRSRHESLIAFSNYHYYDNRLLTFPSPHREGMGVSWHYVPNGIYDRGKSATNKKEADAIVQEIVRRLHDQELRRWSIGVVTFSQAQQTLIENLLEEVRRSDPELDAFFSEDMVEPVFVKNLENVQGDERDVIFFSICYGTDVNGKTNMNFGPMNKEGGERRLNVAITRAKREVLVFSSITADQIDLTRTRARGVRDLKNFLDYADRGSSAIRQETYYDPSADFESPFEKEVHDVLVNNGWQVHLQVGCARYRIDLAVVDPEAPGRYLLGIECDGANYHRAKTARDRDILREGVLRDLGWELHRIWSTDWWVNPKQETLRIEAALAAAREARQKTDSGEVVPTVASGVVEECSTEPTSTAVKKPLFREPIIPKQVRFPEYRPYLVKRLWGTQEGFYDSAASSQIQSLITEVVVDEGPISLKLAARRVAAHWGLNRISGKALDRVRGIVARANVHVDSIGGDPFLWPIGLDPENYEGFRVPNEDPDSGRDAQDLPIQEVANVVLFLLGQQISAPEEEVVREASRLFGYGRTGKLIEDRMRAGIDHLVQKGTVQRDGTSVTL